MFKKNIFVFLILLLLLSGCSKSLYKNLDMKIEIPRFPHNTKKQIYRELAVFYSPDDISAPTSLEEMGFPDKKLFMLHKDHPKLKITMQTVPANRYILEGPNNTIKKEGDFMYITKITKGEEYPNTICCRKLWRMIMHNETFISWIELGNHGYTHSPPDDINLDHHEFSAKQTDCNFNHSLANTLEYCDERFKLARQDYEKIGLDNDKIIVMRFPGYAHTDAALRALLDNDFIGFFGLGEWKCDEEWINLTDGREIMNIPSSAIWSRFFDGKSNNKNIDKCVKKGGIINFMNHWWAMFENNSEGKWNYLIVNDTLNYIEQKYGDKVWWPFGSELALWLYFKRHVNLSSEISKNAIEINAEVLNWNPNWRLINSSFTITLPNDKQLNKVEYQINNKDWQELNKTRYWQENSSLYLNLPFNGNSKVKFSLKQKTI